MPAAHRARAAALFMTAIPAAGVLSGLLAGALLRLQGRLGLDGWQWLFLVDGLPAVILGAMGFVVLTDAPGHAPWLAPEERAWLVETLHTEQASSRQPARSWRDALADPTVWRLGSLTFLMLACAYAYGLWSPQMLKSVSGFSDTRVSLLTSAIAAAAVVGMLLNAAHSERHQERRLHIAAAAFLAGLGWLLCLWADTGPMAVVAFALIAIGINSAYGPLWAVPGAYLTGPARASGIALIVALGSVGGFVGPNLIGITRDATGGYQAAYLTLGLMACGAGLLALRLRSARP
jgi:ACS family tartrate transporter-like MFS transporter